MAESAGKRRGSRARRTPKAPARTVLLTCAVALAAAAPAGADSTPASDFSFPFSSAEPGTPTGLVLKVLYKNPKDPNAKPSPVKRFLFTAPEGTVFDGSAIPACSASDQDFRARGRAACPPDTVVGTGYLTVMTGVPGERPLPVDATLFNSGNGMIEVFTDQRTGSFAALERLRFVGANAFEAPNIAETPGGPPDGKSAAREAYVEFPVTRGPGGKSFITTPPDCPADRTWRSRFDWTNADGNSYTNKFDMQCAPSNAFTIDGVELVRGALDVAVRVPGAGRITVSDASTKRRNGKRVRRIRNARVEAQRAGTVALRPALGSIARRTLARGRPLRIALRVTFVPTGGVAATQTMIAKLR